MTILTVNSEGNLVAPDGVVFGKLRSVEVELFDTGDTLSADPGATGNSLVVEDPVEGKNKANALQESEIAEVWAHYVEVFHAHRQALDEVRKRIIRNALKVRTVGECKRAIDGLRVSAWHHGENDQRKTYLGIQYALKGNSQRGESVDERIDKMIENADSHTPTGVAEIKVQRRLEVIRRWIQSGQRWEPRRAEAAKRELEDWGYFVKVLDAPPWVEALRTS